MRKFLITVLMASAMVPAAAYAERGDRDRGDRGVRTETSSDDASDSRPQRSKHVERSNSDEPRLHVERAERPTRVDRSVDVQASEAPRVRRFERQEAAQQAQQVQQVERVRRTERHRDGGNDGFVGAIQRVGREDAARQQGEAQVRRDRDGFSGLHDRIVRNGNRTDSRHRWSGDWRRDHRYDWRGHRSRYGSLYRLGRYYDPYGWGYRRFSVGFSLWPSYYGSNYWMNDPWQYRLPPAYGPYRWVRYYDDALLVNIYTGQVVDVLYSFFW